LARSAMSRTNIRMDWSDSLLPNWKPRCLHRAFQP
jgi:hypothetical protein